MGYNLNNKFDNSHHNQQHYSGPTSYGADAHFTIDDLGTQRQFNGQYMERSGSTYSSANSYDSAIDAQSSGQLMYRNDSQSSNSTGYNTSTYSPLDTVNPSSLFDQNSQYFPSDSYLTQPVSSAGYSASSYAATWQTPRAELALPYDTLVVDSPTTPMSPGMQPSGVQPSQVPKWICLERNCNISFARQADLQRHYNHKHLPYEKQDTWYCDWKTCPRSESGYREALKRVDQSPSSSPGSTKKPQQKPAGIGPFTRKDHFKAHLRDQHQEAIPKRDAKADPGWMDGKILKPDWWRCSKCLKRVWINSQRTARRSEYTCCGCGAPCDQDLLAGRAERFAASSASAAGGARGRKH